MPRLVPKAAALGLLTIAAACDAGTGAVYEADADRSACAPDYGAFYAGAGALPVRCTAQTTLPYPVD